MEKIRAFIAIPVSEEAKQTVTGVQNELRGAGADVKWVEPRNVHITLKFLGNVATEQVGEIAGALKGSLEGGNSFELTLEGLGTFPPGKRNVRVVWVGICDGKEELVSTATAVEEACAALGFKREERPLSPHLTIGRVRRGSGRLAELVDRAADLQFNPLKVKIDRVNLMRSELSPKGPTYTVLEMFALR